MLNRIFLHLVQEISQKNGRQIDYSATGVYTSFRGLAKTNKENRDEVFFVFRGPFLHGLKEKPEKYTKAFKII